MRRESFSTHIDVSPGEKKQMTPVEEGAPFRILLLGDFSAGQNRARKPIRVDFDNFEEVLARLHPQLEIPGPDAPLRMRFESLDDFHPDALYHALPLFQELRQVREQLLEAPAAPRPRRPSSAPDPLQAALGSGSLLDDIVGGAETPSRRHPFQEAIQDIVAPHVQPAAGAHQAELLSQIDETAQLAMRMLLHHPDFQELEARWRSLDFLLRRLGIGPDLQLYLLDLPKPELLANSAALSRVLADEDPWAVLAGLYTFAAQPEEVRGLASIARLAREAGVPFVSSVSPRLLGCESFGTQPDPEDWTAPMPAEAEAEWNRLRSLPEARWIGLALPRFLLRDAYTNDSLESFGFAEMTAPPNHDDFLWANPAVACVYLLGESFQQDGWDIRLRETRISGLPLHTYEVDGETQMKPCAECWMAERTAEKFLDRGIMPLASMKHTDAVRLIRLQSIAHPAAPLAGRWS